MSEAVVFQWDGQRAPLHGCPVFPRAQPSMCLSARDASVGAQNHRYDNAEKEKVIHGVNHSGSLGLREFKSFITLYSRGNHVTCVCLPDRGI